MARERIHPLQKAEVRGAPECTRIDEPYEEVAAGRPLETDFATMENSPTQGEVVLEGVGVSEEGMA